MTLEQAIQHCKEVAIEYEAKGECYECGKEHRQLAEWLEDYKQLKETTRWIPCSERMPKPSPFDDDDADYDQPIPGDNGNKVLVFMKNGYITQATWYKDDGGSVWITELGYDIIDGEITHWMPLPDHPKEVQNVD